MVANLNVFKKIYICYLPAGRSVLGKTVLEVLRPSSRPRAQFFPIRTDLSRQITFIFFSLENYFIRNIFVDFLLKQFHTVRVHLTFRSRKPVLFTKYLKEETQFSLILELSNEGFTFHGDF